MTEKTLSDRVRDGLRAAAHRTSHPELEWERHESSTVRSVPDVRMRWATFTPWIELKVAKGRLVRFQPGQTRWLAKQWAAVPGSAWVLVGVPRHSKRVGGVMLYRGDVADMLEGVGIVALPPELYLPQPIKLPAWTELLDRLTWGGCPDECGCSEGSDVGL